jgi:hypothetical protein
MATTPTTFFRGAATTTTTTVLGTVPASTTWIVTNIAIANSASSSGTFTLALGQSTNQIPIATTTTVAANSTVFIDLKQPLAATNTITGGASATTVSFHISGIAVA